MNDDERAETAGRVRSRAWWEQRRARGICAVCREPLDGDRSWPVHLVCGRLLTRKYRYAQIRAMTIDERARCAGA